MFHLMLVENAKQSQLQELLSRIIKSIQRRIRV